jgi:aryl-alcohol dehydrogenase-like predicted oxidoreductase
VSEVCLGAMVFGDERGPWGATREECGRIFERFGDAGGNFIDTASNYAGGASERIVGELIGADRDRWVVATKYTVTARPDDPNAGGNGFPHDFDVAHLVYGHTEALIDDDRHH